MTTWTKDRPTAPGLYWVWQPQAVWPCRGKVYAVEVAMEGGIPLLSAWVPFMDYSEHLSDDTWDGAMWAGPITKPEPPQ